MSMADDNGWPPLKALMTLMEERDLSLLEKLGNGRGVAGLASILGSDLTLGLPDPVPDLQKRMDIYGINQFAEKKLNSYWKYVWDALHDKLLLLLLIMATLELIFVMALGTDHERKEGWIEPLAIYVTVFIIVNVQSTLDYQRERMFDNLSKKLASSNERFVVRGGKDMKVTDEQIVVGDIMSFNSHMAANISCDGILISGEDVKADESALTGEPEPIPKSEEAPFMNSGTLVNAGQGKMLVIAVGEHSVAGKIRKQVYDEEGEESEGSPLFQKLDKMAMIIGYVGMVAAAICFTAKMIMAYGVNGENDWKKIKDYVLYAIGILAVAIPEGLPLALTISLAFSSNKLFKENNLVKTLDSCETMGSTTTICTDKTGTLTTNRMTVRGAYLAGHMFEVRGQDDPVGKRVKWDAKLGREVKELVGNLIGVCTMDESGFTMPPEGAAKQEPIFQGNPTECALLKFASDFDIDYSTVRKTTTGRSTETRHEGRPRNFSSSRKMMSWAVPQGSGYRIYAKGASEIILGRVVATLAEGSLKQVPVRDEDKVQITQQVIDPFANSAMRTIGLAYKDVDTLPGDELDEVVKNSDGTFAFCSETDLTLVGIVGIEDPLRLEVKGAIGMCYTAGIDVRMVTGDNLATAIAIAKEANILADEHFNGKVIKPGRAMEGKEFRHLVHEDNKEGEPQFSQQMFDKVWPYLRVLARSSPDDKLTLARGLCNSRLYTNREFCDHLWQKEKIRIFPDQQVVAMTGDGTNDAPALKAASVGFAMGISGTQIAKDAANIILLDDNFASIVTAAKWGRNVFDSIQKFLQFQLTVNIAILVINLIVAFDSGHEVPLNVLQMLWLNLIMDSLASIALASEPPSLDQLKRPPVNRSAFIITSQMWMNMWGQSVYQVIIILLMLYSPEWLPDIPDHNLDPDHPITGLKSRHYTMIFNTFVLMQLFNEWNSRKLKGEFNILSGITQNRLFLIVSISTFILQVIMTQFLGVVASNALKINKDGLTGEQWLVCLAFGWGTWVWQQVINVFSWAFLSSIERCCWRLLPRRKKVVPADVDEVIVSPAGPVQAWAEDGGNPTKRSSRVAPEASIPEHAGMPDGAASQDSRKAFQSAVRVVMVANEFKRNAANPRSSIRCESRENIHAFNNQARRRRF